MLDIEPIRLGPDLPVEVTDIIAGCAIALKYDIAAVSVKPCYLPLVVDELAGSDIAAGTLVAFPHGHSTTAVKVYEALNGIDNGATTKILQGDAYPIQ